MRRVKSAVCLKKAARQRANSCPAKAYEPELTRSHKASPSPRNKPIKTGHASAKDLRPAASKITVEDLDLILAPLACIGKRSTSYTFELESAAECKFGNTANEIPEDQLMDEEVASSVGLITQRPAIRISNSIDSMSDDQENYFTAHHKRLKVSVGS